MPVSDTAIKPLDTTVVFCWYLGPYALCGDMIYFRVSVLNSSGSTMAW